MVQFVVRSRPAIETVTLGIRSREAAIDALLAGLLVTRRELTDVIDVAYIAESPLRAQRIANSTVHAFQSLNVKWARERSRRRGEFLAEQLAQNDSALRIAQAELSPLPEPAAARQLRDKLQAAADAADGARAASAASSRPTVRPSARCWSGSRPTTRTQRREALRALATSPAMADNPAIGGLYSSSCSTRTASIR